MEIKVEIFSKEIIKPSSSNPDHLKRLELSMLDRRVPPIYVPILLFYTCSDMEDDYASMSRKLKNSLSQTLTRFYPLAGRMRSQEAFVDCNDEGVDFLEAKVTNADLSAFLRNPENNLLQLLPFDPFKSITETAITGVQLNVFSCGGIGIGLCISHKAVDGTSVDFFLKAWSATARVVDDDDDCVVRAPRFDSALLFPPKGMNMLMTGNISKDEIATKRFIFNAPKLVELKARLGIQNPSRVESVTALIWKSAMEAAKVNSGKDKLPESIATHVVNLRDRTVPPLSENVFGNMWQVAAAYLLEEEKQDVELGYLAGLIRKAQKEIDSHYVSELQGNEGLAKAYKPYIEVRSLTSNNPQLQCYMFGSWTRFGFYGTDFGWGNPTWVCTTGMPVKNGIILMSTPSGDGIEAWVTLAEEDMVEFEGNPELSYFVSPTSKL